MKDEEYLIERVEKQIDYYDKKGKRSKCWFYTLSILTMTFSAVIPFLSGITNQYQSIKFLIGFLGILISIFSGLLLILKFQEKWVQYRETAELLIQEKYLYISKTGYYKDQNAFNIFVSRVESLINKENINWRDCKLNCVS